VEIVQFVQFLSEAKWQALLASSNSGMICVNSVLTRLE